MRISGTEGYAEAADALVLQYEGAAFAEVQRHVLHLIPPVPSRILDIGAGTGRDAAALAALGHEVTAVEPTDALRHRAMALHPSPRIAWIADGLPHLAALGCTTYDLVMLTAVLMHLDAAERGAAMARLAALVRPGGAMTLSLRHGPVPPGRRMFAVTAAETVRLGEAEGLATLLRLEDQPGARDRPAVRWTWLAFRRPG
jgi:2-polyprenyl-3-methyl-5-hydroxy-6-metoxy-1,4-benzoquinol methylase